MHDSHSFYKVVAGDTLIRIATRYGTTAQKLQKINGIKDINHIEPGQLIALKPEAVNKVSIQVLDRDRASIPNAKMRIQHSGKSETHETDKNGWLPSIFTKTPDDKVKISIKRADDSWKDITEVVSGWGNKIVTLVSPKIRIEAKTKPHPPGVNQRPAPSNSKPSSKYENSNGTPQWRHSDGKAPKVKRRKDSSGLTVHNVSNEPSTIVKVEEGIAPWMNYAINEAKRFKGENEKEITKTINYFKEIGINNHITMAGNSHPWCAAFANWCLKQAGYPIANPRNLGVLDRRSAADGFRQVLKKKGKVLVQNPLFVQIPAPVYGAIAVIVRPSASLKKDDRPGKHVGFVYSRASETHICVLGGNQSDMICFTDFIEKETLITKKYDKKTKKMVNLKHPYLSTHLEYYLPTPYYSVYDSKNKEIENINSKKANSSLNISAKLTNKML